LPAIPVYMATHGNLFTRVCVSVIKLYSLVLPTVQCCFVACNVTGIMLTVYHVLYLCVTSLLVHGAANTQF